MIETVDDGKTPWKRGTLETRVWKHGRTWYSEVTEPPFNGSLRVHLTERLARRRVRRAVEEFQRSAEGQTWEKPS